MRRVSAIAIVTALAVSSWLHAQTPAIPEDTPDRPLPDISTLMREVEEHQRSSETIQKDYIYHEDTRRKDEKGRLQEQQAFDVYWANGVQIHKLTRKDGRDLTQDEKKKEDERIDKEIEKAKERKRKAAGKGEQTDSHGYEEVTVSRFLLLGSFTNPRRVQVDGRDSIVIDYAGDPRAKTRNRFEDVIRTLAGTIWIDEQDRSIVRLEGHFFNNYKIGGGLVMNVRKGTSFTVLQKKINNEVWLPAEVTGQGAARVLLFANFSGKIRIESSDYRKFKTSSRILPGLSMLPEETPSSDQPVQSPPTTTGAAPR